MSKLDGISGIPLGKYREDILEIDLPVVTSTKNVYDSEGNVIEKVKSKYAEFLFTGDHHYGNPAFADTVMHSYLNFIRMHKDMRVGFMGDLLECASLSHFINEEILDIDDQIEAFLADWRDFGKRVDFSLWGNHEERVVRNSDTKNLMRYMMLELGADQAITPDPQRGLFIVFNVGDMKYGCYVHHSKTNARINRKLQLQRTGSKTVASLIAHGHTHELAFVPRTFQHPMLDPTGNPVTLIKRQYMLATGCFLEYPSYAEASSYPLTEVGAPIVRFYADDYKIDSYDLTTSYRKFSKSDSAGAAGPSYDHSDGNHTGFVINEKEITTPVVSPDLNSLHYRKDGKVIL